MEIQNYQPNVEKMYTLLRGFFDGAGMIQSLKALQFARDVHKDQKRKNGVPYIVHPLSMACYAKAIHIRSDDLFATILLHDVVEDCHIPVQALPVNDNVKFAVECMTINPLPNESKIECKKRYFRELLRSREAVICKALDRYDNLTDMPFALKDDAVGKNAAETEILLLPMLKEAKEKWIECSDILFALRTNIRRANDFLKLKYQEDYERWYSQYTDN